MTKTTGFILCLTILAISITGCKPTIENETERYKANILSINKLMTKYPPFEQNFYSLLKDVQLRWAEAEKEKDDEIKAKKMKETNKIIYTNKLYSGLKSYEKNINKIIKLQKKLESNKKMLFKAMIKNAVYSSNAGLKDAAEIIDKARPADFNEAVKIIGKANEILISAKTKLEKVKKTIKKSRK